MTTSPVPDFKLDPSVLAESVPLRRVGTEEVCSRFILFTRPVLIIVHRIWQVQSCFLRVELAPM